MGSASVTVSGHVLRNERKSAAFIAFDDELHTGLAERPPLADKIGAISIFARRIPGP